MQRLKEFSISLTKDDIMDVTLHIKKGIILKFALNYRALIGTKWHAVYRVDNCHKFLHEQKFWRSPDPIPLTVQKSLNEIVKQYKDKIIHNFQKYRKYFIEAKLE